MISVIVERPPADKQGPNISNPLITSNIVAIECGRNKIDYSYTNRELVSGTGPEKGWVRQGRIIEVADSEQNVWRGKTINCQIVIDMRKNKFAAATNIEVERVAR